MKTNFSKRIAYLATMIALGGFGPTAFALSTWTSSNFGSLCNSSGAAVAAAGNWGKCGSASSSDPSFMGLSTAVASSPYSGTSFAGAAVYDWGDTNGLGVINKYESNTTGPHAVDNTKGTDAILFRFSEAVTLSSFTIGWNGTDDRPNSTTYNDSDVSVLAWAGGANPTTTGPATTGWTWIGNFSNVGTGSNTQSLTPMIGTNTVYSSYWLISAYNTAYGNTNNDGNLKAGKDAFKVLAIAGNTQPPGNQTPEPGSLALLGLGLVGLVAARRRSGKSV